MCVKKYSTVLIDVDDTILDFYKDEYDALKLTLEQCGLPCDEEIISIYSKINADLWHRHENGEITKEDIKNTRFGELFSKLNFVSEYTPRQVNDIYAKKLCSGSAVISGAYEVCEYLGRKYDLYVVTNGIELTQKSRLARNGFDKLMTDMFISESIGLKKPDSDYFDYVFSHINEKDKSKVILIGDSLSSDIKGAVGAGIDCVWLNRYSSKNDSTSTPTYEISDISEIMSIL